MATSEFKGAVYFDSGVIIALARGPEDMHYSSAVKLKEMANQSGRPVITSKLAIMEAIGVIRKRNAMSRKYMTGSDKEGEEADDDAQQAVAHMLEAVALAKAQGLIRIAELKGWSPDLDLLYTKMLMHAGSTRPGKKGRTGRHRGVGACDWFHFTIAKDAGATTICTTDAALADIAGNDDDFGHIRILLTGSLPSNGLWRF